MNMLEVELDIKAVHKLSALTQQPEWDYLLAYISQIIESERDKTEKVDNLNDLNTLQGSLKRLRKIAKLREDISSMRASAAHEAEDRGE